MLSFQYNWECIIYFFAAGGVLFLLGLVYPFFRGDVTLRRSTDRLAVFLIVITLLLHVALYFAWQFAAIGSVS